MTHKPVVARFLPACVLITNFAPPQIGEQSIGGQALSTLHSLFLPSNATPSPLHGSSGSEFE
jgi:hypothetical protein